MRGANFGVGGGGVGGGVLGRLEGGREGGRGREGEEGVTESHLGS